MTLTSGVLAEKESSKDQVGAITAVAVGVKRGRCG